MAQLPPVDVLITPFINDLADLNGPVVLVFDDYHLISNNYVHDIIQFIIDHRPSLLHLVLLTREDPPLALARMRAKGEIIEFRAGALRFSEAETAVFMTGTMKLDIESEVITTLNIATEGWIAGLQLAALSMQGRTPEEIDGFIVDFSGCNRYIIDYLVSEVLSNLPKEVSDFLQQTAVLDRLCAPLCNAVTGREDSRQLLELLERGNLFLFPLDDQRQWYRYHHLFADALHAELSQEEQRSIHQKAARWYEADGYLEDAVAQAIAAFDYREAGRLIYLAASEIFLNGRLKTLISWLDALPDDFIRTNGELALCKMYILYFLGQIETIEPYITAFENDPQAHTSALNRGRLCTMRSVLANGRNDPLDLQLAKEALALVKDSDVDYINGLNTYGLALCRAGNLIEAIKIFRESFGLGQKQGYTIATVLTLINLITSLELNGRLGEATRVGEDVLAEMIDYRGLPLPLAKVVYLPLGLFHYKANDLEQALKFLIEGIDICRRLSINRLLNGEHILALIYNALGDSQKSLTTIREAIQETNPSIQPLSAFDSAALEAELLLRQGELKPALDWAEFWRLTPADKPTLLREQSYFTFTSGFYWPRNVSRKHSTCLSFWKVRSKPVKDIAV